jgi:hypothetical protein
MKKILTVNTRWQYYVSNIAGLIIIIGLITWFVNLSIGNNGLELSSIFFWLAVLLMIVVPFALISFFSSMKSVIVTNTTLEISYVFQKHTNLVNFSEIKEFKSKVKPVEKSGPSGLRDSFTIQLNDGRTFEFNRSQFDNYDKLKAIVYKACR